MPQNPGVPRASVLLMCGLEICWLSSTPLPCIHRPAGNCQSSFSPISQALLHPSCTLLWGFFVSSLGNWNSLPKESWVTGYKSCLSDILNPAFSTIFPHTFCLCIFWADKIAFGFASQNGIVQIPKHGTRSPQQQSWPL